MKIDQASKNERGANGENHLQPRIYRPQEKHLDKEGNIIS
jgi:hypothetical protein